MANNLKRDLTFRRATIEDAGIIARFGAATFEAAYGEDNDPEDMEAYLSANFNLQTIQSQLSDGSTSCLLGFEGAKVFGYAMLREGPIPQSVAGPRPIELARFYVRTEIIGQGYGSALMEACLDEVREIGCTSIWLGVWKRNKRAICFYEKWGFAKVGMKEFTVGSDVQSDFIMARSV